MGHVFHAERWAQHSDGVSLVINKWIWILEKVLEKKSGINWYLFMKIMEKGKKGR